ncbi:S8 family peptidase [Thermoflavimicrobium dichotomicum]|uniref:Serine protease AprX n=1 Tax=Thermoflavimicrobium dichotomicum TaxID=46223 RepID=A0A1I3MSE3_9BACL|nr:S8 family peptidase [Thermoflavimicrobium dichotomicum]SFI99943.1 serine protease AprX [Thermoflavimicrobium dichotomicum]
MVDVNWINENQALLDQRLRFHLTERLTGLKYLPQTWIQKRLKILNVPVLVQWDENYVQPFTSLHNPLTKVGYPVKNYIKNIHAFSLPLSILSLQQLLTMKGIKKIYLDCKVKICLDIATPTTQAHLIWPQDNQGEGATIAIIDTGIAPHPDIQSRIIAFHDFVNQKHEPYDDNGHGTHCAGCAAGDGSMSDGKYKGTAPKALLVGVKVLGKFGEGYLSDVIAGIDWCIEHRQKYNIRVISLSLGTESADSYQDDPVCQIVQKAWQNGIVVTAAAGNNGPNEKTISSPGIDPTIITVGAVDTNRTLSREDDYVASFSSRGPTVDGYMKPDIVAPGSNIISLRSKGSYLDITMIDNQVGSHYFSLSGTSMATPMVAGIVSTLLTKNPELSPDKVKQILLNHAYALKDSNNAQGKGLVDAFRSYQSLL